MSVRTARWTALAVLCATPAIAANPEPLEPVETIADADFETEFEQFAEVPAEPDLPRDAVDITSFDPPIEEEPATRSIGSGVASYYGKRFHGRRTANGERFDMNAMTAAHRTLPFGTKVEVTNPANGRSVVVRINDRGPFTKGRTIDLSRSAAQAIGLVQRGHGTVQLALLD